MEFIKSKSKDFYLSDTKIENIFINEYMPAAPGDYVKVFLYGYMNAEHGLSMSIKDMAAQLDMKAKDVEKAWSYWENMGVIRRRELDAEGEIEPAVEFLSMKELMYGKAKEPAGNTNEAPEPNIFGNDEVKKLFEKIEQLLARDLSSTELTDVIAWIQDDGITPEAVLTAFDYSVERGKTNLKYIGKVVHNWHDEGLYTTAQIEEHLSEVDSRFYEYKRVLKALGMNRMPTEAERSMMDGWFDDLGYNMDKVLEACAKTVGISSPNLNYVNKVLENWSEESKRQGGDVNDERVSRTVLTEYLETIRDRAEREAEQRRNEAYEKVPRIREIDREISKLGTELAGNLLAGKGRADAAAIQEKMDRLSEERAVELTDHGYSMDYTDVKYKCAKCNDTGMNDLGEQCTCIPERIKEARVWMKTPEGKRAGK